MSDGLSNSNFACLQFHPKRVLKFGSWSSAETRVPKTCKREYQKFISYIQQYLWGTMGHQTGDQALARQILCRVKKSFRCSRFGARPSQFLPWTTRRCGNIGRVRSRTRSNRRARSWAWTTLRFQFRFCQRGRSVSFAFAFRDSEIFLRAEICFAYP